DEVAGEEGGEEEDRDDQQPCGEGRREVIDHGAPSQSSAQSGRNPAHNRETTAKMLARPASCSVTGNLSLITSSTLPLSAPKRAGGTSEGPNSNVKTCLRWFGTWRNKGRSTC